MELTMAQCWSLATRLNGGRTDYETSELSLYANMALTDIAGRVEFESLASHVVSSSTSGDSQITTPANCQYVTSLSNLSVSPDSKGRTLEPASAEWIDSNSTYPGRPLKYAVYRNQIMLWPSADSTYSFQVRFQEKAPVLTASTATPAIDERYHESWAYKTAAICAAMREDLDGERIHTERYLGMVNSMPTDRSFRQQGRPSLRLAYQRKH